MLRSLLCSLPLWLVKLITNIVLRSVVLKVAIVAGEIDHERCAQERCAQVVKLITSVVLRSVVLRW